VSRLLKGRLNKKAREAKLTSDEKAMLAYDYGGPRPDLPGRRWTEAVLGLARKLIHLKRRNENPLAN
jgi:hypothetical protein